MSPTRARRPQASLCLSPTGSPCPRRRLAAALSTFRTGSWLPAVGLILPLLIGWFGSAAAHRELFTPEEKDHLRAAERIQLEVLALTDRGATDAQSIASAVTTRLANLGYTVLTDRTQPSDVAVKVKCEARKTWEGPVTSGGDADQPDAAARLWKGPACQLTYRVNDRPADWRYEVRGRSQAVAPAPDGPPESDEHVMADLTGRLAEDPFPYILAGAWNQPSRLMKTLDDPAIPPPHRAVIITLLGNMSAVEAIPALNRVLHDGEPALAQNAAVALGSIGHPDCIPLLLQHLPQAAPEARLAVIKGLGRLAPLHPNSNIVPALLARLPTEPLPAQIEIVRALGKTTDRRILEPLRALNRSVQEHTRSDSSPEWKELKRALGQSLDQFDGVHTEE